ncbi:DUF4214 domain-containing protein [Sulfitobacter sp. 1A13353]|uniref:DUF4214 domain-containing protein n=1 Tax=Sulfitobacter sp. 1A13353 TaxID=3368568 RepID=UPI0037469F9E
MATSTQINAITALYVGYFDRAPDPAGLQFWIDQLDNGREYNTIAADFAASPEAVALYPYLTTPDVSSPASFVTNIYANLFGRTPDQEGLDFWTGVLEDGSVSVADMIEAIIMGARDDAAAGTFDKSVLDNKVEVGLDFATSAAEVPGFEFDAAAKAAAVAAVNGVTEDEATVEAAKEATDAFVSGDSNPGTGDNLTLTDAIGESVVGTAGNDTFTGVVDGGTSGTLQFGDQIDGGAGRDTLNLFTGGSTGIPAGVEISNIEVVNINSVAAGSPVDATDFGSAAEEIWQVGSVTRVEKLAQGQTAGFRAVTTGLTQALGVDVVYADSATSGTIALDNTGNIRVDVVGEELTELTITGSSNPNATVEQVVLSTNGPNDLPELETLNVNVSSDIELNLGGSEEYFKLKTVDASGSTGGITSDLPDIDGTNVLNDALKLESIMGGSGDDEITVELDLLGADSVTIDAGAGDDTLNLEATSDDDTTLTITLGEGKDIVNFGTTTGGTFTADGNGLANAMVDTTAKTIDGMISITDFTGSDDVLALSGATVYTLTNVEETAVKGKDTLFEAADAALKAATTNDTVAFQYNDSTYVVVDNGTTGFNTDDGIIELTGFTGTLNAANFDVA